MYKLPYYSSLNSQMAEYYKQVKMQEYNDTYQQAQLDIVLDGQRNLASTAEIMNRLTELQQEIANQTVNKIIPLEKTNAPEKIKQEEKLPISFDNVKVSTKKPAYKVENRKGLIDELKEKLQKRKKTQMITEVFPEVNKKEVNKLLDNVLSDLINQGLQKKEVMKGAENFVDNLIKKSAFKSSLSPLDVNAPYSYNFPISKEVYKPTKIYYKKTGKTKIESPLESLLTKEGIRKLPTRTPILTERQLNKRTGTYEKKKETVSTVSSGGGLIRNSKGQFIKKS